ncbi:MAG: ATP-dependent sacrificial sulfur transferase LarE [Thermodesulfovibrionales bacterium]|nr:ATP-dependent sacrificial sulfur transferase LarE [Thermodesulfovibrionales bacterium]
MNTYDLLLSYIKSIKSTIVAFSGGVDSSLLLKIVKDASIKACAVTISSEFTDNDEIDFAKTIAGQIGINHIIKPISLLSSDKIKSNPKDRCYHCKRIIFENLHIMAKELGFETIIEGTNTDDTKEWRPGIKALKELNIISPFMELKITKEDIRNLSQSLGLSTWNKPSSPCLATRFYYGSEITKGLVEKVKLAEFCLKEKGFQNVRIRTNGLEACIEIESIQIQKLTNDPNLPVLIQKFKDIGFKIIKLDLEGYKRGKLDTV